MSELIISISGIRGIVGDSLDPAVALRFAAAFAEIAPPGPILVASDGRTSGDALRSACLAALSAAGRPTIDLGIATTPTTEVAVIARDAAGAIIVTASHNPPEWNGLKFLDPRGIFIRQATLDRLLDRWRNDARTWNRWDGVVPIERWDGAAREHIDRILALDVIDVDRCRHARIPVVVDSICASAGLIAPRLLEELGCTVTLVNGEVTGRFPRVPEPVPENIAVDGDAVRRARAAIGLVYDPDGDRLALLDETGTPIGEEYTLALTVRAIRERKPGGPVVVNASTSRMVDDIAADLGFAVHRTPVGEINVVEGMFANGAELGGEGNGGLIYGPLHFGRDGLLAAAVVMDLLARERKPLGELVRRIPRYEIVKEKITIDPARRDAYLARLAKSAEARGAALDACDGVKLIWADRWLHVRRSNTEPIVRIIAEAPSRSDADGLIRIAREMALV